MAGSPQSLGTRPCVLKKLLEMEECNLYSDWSFRPNQTGHGGSAIQIWRDFRAVNQRLVPCFGGAQAIFDNII